MCARVSVCVDMHAHTCACAHVFACMENPEINFRCYYSGAFHPRVLFCVLFWFWNKVSHGHLRLPIHLDWLPIELQGPNSLCPAQPWNYKCMSPAQLLMLVLRIKLKSSCLHNERFTDGAISPLHLHCQTKHGSIRSGCS